MRTIVPQERLIVAVDETKYTNAARLCEEAMEGGAVFFKIGLRTLATNFGIKLVESLKSNPDIKVFVDVKLYDIPDQVYHATKMYAELGVDFITVHAFPQNVRAAVDGCIGTNAKILAVTVLTSHTEGDIENMMYTQSLSDIVQYRAEIAHIEKCDGFVCSPAEASVIKSHFPNNIIVCPGIRDNDNTQDDQHRRSTLETAFMNGADYIVVGRPIRQSNNIKDTTQTYITRINNVFNKFVD